MTYEEMLDLYNSSSDLHGIPLAYKNYSNRLLHEEIFYPRIETDGIVRDTAAENVESGPFSIAQIVYIYRYLIYGRNDINSLYDIEGWRYISDPPDSLNYMFANDTLESGAKIGCTGYGDCDDFAIVMTSLIRAIGGSSRIIVVQDKNGTFFHAYSEVYLGVLDEPDDKIYYLADLIRQIYGIDSVYVHLDPSSKRIWLNLDSRMDLGGESYPGCPFRSGIAHNVLGPEGDKMMEVDDLGYRSIIKALDRISTNNERITIKDLVDLVSILTLFSERQSENSDYSPETMT